MGIVSEVCQKCCDAHDFRYVIDYKNFPDIGTKTKFADYKKGISQEKLSVCFPSGSKQYEKMLFSCLLLTYFLAIEATFCPQSDEKTLHIRPSEKNCSNFIACINFEEFEFSCIQAPLFIPWTDEACMTPCPAEKIY